MFLLHVCRSISNAECSGLPLIICTDNPGRVLAVVSRQRT